MITLFSLIRQKRRAPRNLIICVWLKMAVLSAAGIPLFDWLTGSFLLDKLSDWGSMNNNYSFKLLPVIFKEINFEVLFIDN